MDLGWLAVVFVSDIFDGVSGIVEFGDDVGGNASACNDGAAKGDSGVDDEGLFFGAHARHGLDEGEEAFGDAVFVPVNAGEEVFKAVAHDELAGAGGVDQAAYGFDEEIDAVGLELNLGEGVGGVKFLAEVVDCFSGFVEADAVIFADGAEDVGFDEVNEGELGEVGVGALDDGGEGFGAGFGGVGSACEPGAESRRRNLKVAGGVGYRVDGGVVNLIVPGGWHVRPLVLGGSRYFKF